jgi:glycosyltransferase involved in cell wall biosynthesis
MQISSRPRVLLLIPHLGGGGAERVTALLAKGLPAEKYELHLGLITEAESNEELPPWVTVHALGAPRVRAGAFRLLLLVRQLKPDLILSGMFHLNFLVLLLRPFFPRGTHVVVRQNATVSSILAFGGVPWYTRLLYRRLYRHADRVICQTRAMAEDLAEELGLADRIAVLPNPVDVERIRHSISQDQRSRAGRGPHLLAVGRLSREKGVGPGTRTVFGRQPADCRYWPRRGGAEGRVPRIGNRHSGEFSRPHRAPLVVFPGGNTVCAAVAT